VRWLAGAVARGGRRKGALSSQVPAIGTGRRGGEEDDRWDQGRCGRGVYSEVGMTSGASARVKGKLG
jgi:hypothetical protein